MKLIVFGLGNYFQIQKLKLMRLPDIEIVAFADNNCALWGKKAEGEVPVISPADILTTDFDRVVIVSLYVRDIFWQLLELGIDRDKIISWPHFWAERMKGQMEVFAPEAEAKKCKKRVLIISNDLNYDGASLAAIHAAEAVSRHYHAVLAVPAGNKKLITESVAAGITVAVCAALPWIGEVERNWIGQFDVVIVNTYPMIESVLEIRKFVPVLWWLHESAGNYPIVEMQYPYGLPERRFEGVHICAVSKIARRNFNNVYPERCKTILPLGIPDKKKREEKNDRNAKTIFAIIGVVYEQKGQDFFLEAAEKLGADAEAEFWVIGRMEDTEFGRKIKKKAEGMCSVRLMGELSREEMNIAFSKIDVVVCASQEETLSITIIEGMMWEKVPVVTSNTGIADYIENGKNGFLIKYKDIDSLAEKMKWIISHKEKMTEMRKAARRTYEACFSIERFGENLKKMSDETRREWTTERK